MEERKPKNRSEKIFQLIGIIIPIITFILGYGFSLLERNTEKMDKINNIRYIVGMELAQNLEYLSSIQRPNNYNQPVHPQLVTLMSNNLSLNIYNAYLNQIADLKMNESKAIFKAYLSIQYLQAQAYEYSNINKSSNKENSTWKAQLVVLLIGSESAYKDVLAAVSILPIDEEKMIAIKNSYGKAIKDFESIKTIIENKNH